jgi:hypothetical protein
MAHRTVERSSALPAPRRRFAPPTAFLCGACYLEVFAGRSELVWANGSRVPLPDVTLARALRLVARGTWVELRASPDRKTPHPRMGRLPEGCHPHTPEVGRHPCSPECPCHGHNGGSDRYWPCSRPKIKGPA